MMLYGATFYSRHTGTKPKFSNVFEVFDSILFSAVFKWWPTETGFHCQDYCPFML